MKLVYVFNYMETEGYICRVPLFLAKVMTRGRKRTWDYSESLDNL
jgi:hypothetical protein